MALAQRVRQRAVAERRNAGRPRPMARRCRSVRPRPSGRPGATCAPSRSPATCRSIAGSTRAARSCSGARPVRASRHSRPALLSPEALRRPTQGFVAVLLVDEAPDGAQTLISRGFCNLTHRKDDTAPGGGHSGRGDVGHRAASRHRVPRAGGSPARGAGRLGLLADPLARAGARDADPPARHLEPAPAGSHGHIRRARTRAPCPTLPKRDGKKARDAGARGIDGTLLPHRSRHGETLQRFFLDGGVFGPVGDMRLDEIGTVLSDISDRRYTIHADDPLSARATMEQTAGFTRDDWAVKIEPSPNRRRPRPTST
jgi:hypothetical protein